MARSVSGAPSVSFEEPFHAAESMTIRGEERGQILITVDGVSMDWRSSLAVRNHYGGSVAAELALGIELPDATWPQSWPTLARRARCGGADIVERKVKTSLAIPVQGWRAHNGSAKIHQDELAWSTRGTPIGREPSPTCKRSDARGRWLTVQQWRDYGVDMSVSVVMHLDPVESAPTLDDVAAALPRPARSLFIGRKNCLPSGPLLVGAVEAPDCRTALRTVAPAGADRQPATWPALDGPGGSHRQRDVTDERNWITGLHGGARRVCEGSLGDMEDGVWRPI